MADLLKNLPKFFSNSTFCIFSKLFSVLWAPFLYKNYALVRFFMSLFKPENDSRAGRRCLKDEYKLCSVHSEVELSCVQNFCLFSCNNNDDKLCINVSQMSQTSQNVSLTLLSQDNLSDQLSHCLCHLDKLSRFLSHNSKWNFSPTFPDPFGCSRTAMDLLLSSFRILRISGRSFSTFMLSNERILSEIF